RLRAAIYKGMELNAAFSFAIFVGLAAVASDLVPFLFGQKWAAASILCTLLSLYTLIVVLTVFFHPALLASGGIGKYVLLNVWHALGVVLVCILGIKFGVIYLVLGLILNGIIAAIPALYFLKRRIGLDPLSYGKPCLVPAAASVVMVLSVILVAHLLPLDSPIALKLFSKVALGAVSYIGFMALFNRPILIKVFDTLRHAFSVAPETATTPSTVPL